MREVASIFLFLGCVAFGGPAAHVTLMRRTLVQRRQWLSEDEFFRLFAACQLIPGPSSTELAVLLGHRRAGWRGLVVAAVCFIAPAMIAMLLLAVLYQHVGSGSAAQRVLRGVTPVVVGIVVWAVLDLGRRLVVAWSQAVVCICALVAALLVNQPIAVLAGGGLLLLVLRQGHRLRVRGGAAVLPTVPVRGFLAVGAALQPSLLAVFATFLKLGAVAFGSGYVLLVFLRSELVLNLHWLTDRQVVDAIAISQATPGPVFTTATFAGYLVAGVGGALLATLGIFLPGVALAPLAGRIARGVTQHAALRDLLSGVNLAALGLILAVAISLARESFIGVEPVLAAAVSVLVLLRWPLAAPPLIVAGAVAGALWS